MKEKGFELPLTTRRTLEFYRQCIGLDLDKCEGKVIVNFGAGLSELRDELEQRGVHPRAVFGVDKIYTTLQKRYSFLAQTIPSDSVGGDMRQPPFVNDSADFVLFQHSLSWILSEKEKAETLAAAYRICKPGGEIRIYPAVITDDALKKLKGIQFEAVSMEFAKLVFADLAGKNISGKISKIITNLGAAVGEVVSRRTVAVGERIGRLVIKKTTPQIPNFDHIVKELIRNGAYF